MIVRLVINYNQEKGLADVIRADRLWRNPGAWVTRINLPHMAGILAKRGLVPPRFAQDV